MVGPPRARSKSTASSMASSISMNGIPRRMKITGEKNTSAAATPCRFSERQRSDVINARSSGPRMIRVTWAKCWRNSEKLRWRYRDAGSEGKEASRPGRSQSVLSRGSVTVPSR